MGNDAIKIIQDNATKRLDDMIAKIGQGGAGKAFLQRVIYPMYQQAQVDRWESDNTSEGTQWDEPESAVYRKYKLKKYAGHLYGGSKTMFATGDLFKSIVGKSEEWHRKVTTSSSLFIATTIPYAKYLAIGRPKYTVIKRPFMKFGERTKSKWREAVSKYILSRDK